MNGGSIQRSCFPHVPYWHCGSIFVSYTRGARFEPFKDVYFCHQIHLIQGKHLGKTSIAFSHTWLTTSSWIHLMRRIKCQSSFSQSIRTQKIQWQDVTSNGNRTLASHNLRFQVQHSPFYTNLIFACKTETLGSLYSHALLIPLKFI